MEQSKVNMYINMYKDKVKSNTLPSLKSALEKANDEAENRLAMAKIYNPITTLLLSIFLGGLAVDRFYIGDIGLGVAKLLLGWITFGIWPLIDIFCSYSKTKQKNYSNIMMNL